MKPILTISYCPKCHWLLRAAYVAQEMLSTFEAELDAVTLKPSEISGEFALYVNDKLLFDRKTHGGFAEIKELKQMLRDIICPEKSLGHSDR
ncbi:SelT/SelW/SelH family protein [Cytophagaceae bacterium 50C-KIRBA]|uniref:SelT/SelW/SelH family protein n=1 Tax=Aquirufa beregesia TaxID=2516556 RepID=A0ABX0EWZ4_9BACT|nr:SelT/SelW/SelH family protein [Aquirufa beregesia]NGZ44648.1 SelT/SelW/SelH family protein [Aquirufa beregesia]